MHRVTKRTIVMVDVENALGKPAVAREEVAELFSRLQAAFGTQTQYVLAASHSRNAFQIGLACPGRRLVWKEGKDGADLALEEEIVNQTTLTQFTDLVLVSGDGLFASSVAIAAAAGLRTVVLSRHSTLSRKLQLAAHRTVIFNHPVNINEVA